MDGLFLFCEDVVHEMLSIGRISESRRRICHLNDAIQKYISLRVTLGLPSIFAWQARMRSLGFRLQFQARPAPCLLEVRLRVKKENYPDDMWGLPVPVESTDIPTADLPVDLVVHA